MTVFRNHKKHTGILEYWQQKKEEEQTLKQHKLKL